MGYPRFREMFAGYFEITMSNRRVKRAIYFVLAALLTAGGYRYFTKRPPAMNSVYLIPDDAVYFIATDRPLSAWHEFRESGIWRHAVTHPFFEEINGKAKYLDSMINANRRLLDYIGEKPMIVSVHPVGTSKYGYLYIVDMAEKSNLLQFKSFLAGLLDGGYRVTQWTYKGVDILELFDKKSRETLYVSVIKNNLLFSYTHTLIERSIEQETEPVIGRNLKFIEVFRRTPVRGHFRVYVQYSGMPSYIRYLTGSDQPVLPGVMRALVFSGFDVTIDGRTLRATGYTAGNDRYGSIITALHGIGKGTPGALDIAPERSMYYLGIQYGEFDKLYSRVEENLKNRGSYAAYRDKVSDVERLLDIDIQRDFYDWVGDEIALFSVAIPESVAGLDANVLVLKTKNKARARERLAYITRQIRKKTPVKFKQIRFKEHEIYYLSIKGFFKMFLGGYFDGITEPYFTYIGDYVVFASHPNTLKYVISQYGEKRTLHRAKYFQTFAGHLDKESNVFLYVNTPALIRWIAAGPEGRQKRALTSNASYLEGFTQWGASMSADDGLFESRLSLTVVPKEERLYSEEFSPYSTGQPGNASAGTSPIPQRQNGGQPADTIVVAPIHPQNLDDKVFVEYYSDRRIKRKVPLRDGVPHGKYKEYHINGKIKIRGRYKKGKPAGKWKMYDVKGNLVREYDFSPDK